MKKIKKYLSVVLCLIIAIGCFAAIPASALTYPAMGEISSSSGVASIYTLPGTYGHETAENKYQSQKIDTLSNGTVVKVLGIEKDGDGDPWYKINYAENFAKSGYAYATRVLVNYEHNFDADFEKNLENFPQSYHAALRELHTKYPNWKFVANQMDITFKSAIEAQYGVVDVTATRKWVEFSYGDNEWRDIRGYNPQTDSWLTLESRWTYASRAAIEYFMDPRNSLNEDKIFAFMQQSYQADTNMQNNLKAVIKGTFLENGYDKNGDGIVDKDAYIEDIITAAQSSKVSPYVLAATIIVEQGVNGESNLISGTYPGYEGYYNFFNFNAAGSTVDAITQNGLAFAKQNGWNSRKAAIVGGAQKYADGYITAGQDTYFYKDFNVIKQDWNHQYASALYDAWTNAAYLKKGCMTNSNAELTFSIPVFADMPQVVCPNPSDMISTVVENDAIIISTKKSGIYALDKSSSEIDVFDKEGKSVKYNQSKKGWPLVANQEYTIKLKNYSGDYSSVTFNIQKTFDTIFPDTSANEWYNDAIIYNVGRDIMSGYGSTGYFGTADNIQRQDFLVMLARFDGVDLTQYANKISPFPDVPNSNDCYYKAAVIWGYENEIVSGYQDGKFGTGDKITREQLVKFLYNYANYKNLDTSYSSTAATEAQVKYSDYNQISDWAFDSVMWAIEKGIISGKAGETIAPGGNALRCEVAQIMYNIFFNNTFK